jgi:1-deoxy-D-xylulose-5-phosphate synthase
MSVLDRVGGPADLRSLTAKELCQLAAEIREFLVEQVSRSGGHLGPNLGAVELTIAVHRVFDSPTDRIIWDTGHQAYVHKILTGRRDGFDLLRTAGGLSGYPSRAESPHDLVENSHASTALSYADGLAKAWRLTGETGRVAVAVVGDGALTGGMAWEALNNIAAADRPIVIVVNDNGRSYAPTIGGLADHLAALRTTPSYERFLRWGKRAVLRTPVVGERLYGALHGVKKGLKDIVAPQAMFEDLGIKYVGPVDGHDLAATESALRRARGYGGPVIVHCVTEKGKGHAAAEQHQLDKLHAVSPARPAAPGSAPAPAVATWTSVFSAELLAIGAERRDVVAITAAMLEPTGLRPFALAYPDRAFDVGIAEQHAVASAAGLALGGLHPVVAIYATFLNRAFDQTLMDVALHGCGVTFVLDRAGITGDDGPSHNGMWDLSILQVVPRLRVAAPRDGDQLRALLREALGVRDAPTAVRFPKGAVPPPIPAIGAIAGMEVLHEWGAADVLLVAIGAMAGPCREAGELLAEQGVGALVVDPRWIKPVNPALAGLAAARRLMVTVEDNGRVGGAGAAVAQALADDGVRTPVRVLGLPQRFLDHGKRADILAQCGLTGPEIAERVRAALNEPSGSAEGEEANKVNEVSEVNEATNEVRVG